MTELLKNNVTADATANAASGKTPAGSAGDAKAAESLKISEAPNVTKPLDPFDPATLRLDQSFTNPSVKKLLATVPIRKPRPQDFVRVHPGLEFRGTFGLIEFNEDREYYLLPPEIAHALPGEFRPCSVYTSITRQEKVFLWPVKLPNPDGRQNEWHRSAAEAVRLAEAKWVRIKADMQLGAYEISVAEAALSEPNWPDYAFSDLLRIAFRDRLVDTLDHLVIKKLRGLV